MSIAYNNWKGFRREMLRTIAAILHLWAREFVWEDGRLFATQLKKEVENRSIQLSLSQIYIVIFITARKYRFGEKIYLYTWTTYMKTVQHFV